ncbi:DUF3992 domain-containing protein [Bacillus tianshenii]|nr:DUF3992 domain-containing protein [Bacillus tianshenii]
MGKGCCPDRPIVKDELCANWEATCNADYNLLWEADNDVIKPFGTVTILVENSCDGVEIFVNGTASGNKIASITEGESFSKTISNLRSVYVRCLGGTGNICCGKLCMTVHYKRC